MPFDADRPPPPANPYACLPVLSVAGLGVAAIRHLGRSTIICKRWIATCRQVQARTLRHRVFAQKFTNAPHFIWERIPRRSCHNERRGAVTTLQFMVSGRAMHEGTASAAL